MTTTFCNIAYRVFTLIRNIDQIYDISNQLDSPLFAPRDDDETKLYMKSWKSAKIIIYPFIGMVAYVSTLLSWSPIFTQEYPFEYR